MKLNILTYGNTPNPLGIPSAWPAIVQQVADNAPAPAAPWIEMTLAQYQSYVATNQAAYDAWEAGQTSTQQSNLAVLSNQYDNAITAMQTFSGIGSPTTAQAVQAVQTHNTILLKLLPLLRKMYLDSLQ